MNGGIYDVTYVMTSELINSIQFCNSHTDVEIQVPNSPAPQRPGFHIHEIIRCAVNFRPVVFQLTFLTLCDQAFNPPFLGGKFIELAKFFFMNKRFEPNLSFFSKPVIVSHCV